MLENPMLVNFVIGLVSVGLILIAIGWLRHRRLPDRVQVIAYVGAIVAGVLAITAPQPSIPPD